jgi:tellurite resistance protein TerC
VYKPGLSDLTPAKKAIVRSQMTLVMYTQYAASMGTSKWYAQSPGLQRTEGRVGKPVLLCDGWMTIAIEVGAQIVNRKSEMIEITPWHWAGFILLVLICIAADMGAFHSRARAVTFREALGWSALWFVLALLFAGWLGWVRSREESAQFIAGYLIELSLSLDNILVISLIFAAFQVPPEFQRRVLVWGILGALATRGLMIGAGAALVQHFQWVLYLFGGFLLVTGARMFFARPESVQPEKNPVIRFARKLFPVAPALDGQKFLTRVNGTLALTPLMLVLLLVETSDLIFAVDSVPAVFAVTQKAFIVFTSNVFAVLGLRSLYFLLASAIGKFRHLKAGLAAVLVLVGVKMLLDPHDRAPQWFQVKIPTTVSLLVIAAVLTAAIGLSLAATERERKINRG